MSEHFQQEEDQLHGVSGGTQYIPNGAIEQSAMSLWQLIKKLTPRLPIKRMEGNSENRDKRERRP